MGKLPLGLDEYLSSRSSSLVSSPPVSSVRRLVPLEPLVQQELRELVPLVPQVVHARAPLPKPESYPENLIDVLAPHTVHTSMPSVLDDPIWKSKRQISQELGVYTSISQSSNTQSSNTVEVRGDARYRRHVSGDTFHGALVPPMKEPLHFQTFATPVLERDPHSETPWTPSAVLHNGKDEAGETSGSLLTTQTDPPPRVGTQMVIYKCPVPGHPHDPVSNNVVEHMLKNKCSGGMVMEIITVAFVCVDCTMHTYSQDTMRLHLGNCKPFLARKRTESARDVNGVFPFAPERQPSPFHPQLSSLEPNEGVDASISRRANPATGSNLDEDQSGPITRYSSSSLSSISQFPFPHSDPFDSLSTKPRPLQQLTAINFAPLTVLKALGASDVSDFTMGAIDISRSSLKGHSTVASPPGTSAEHADNDDSEDSKIVRESLELNKETSSAPSTPSSSVLVPILTGRRSSGLSSSSWGWTCSQCTLNARYDSRDLVDSHIKEEQCGGRPTKSLDPESTRCHTCFATFLGPSELDKHECVKGRILASGSTSSPMTASKLEDGGKTKEKSPRRGKSRKSAAQIPKNATQPRQSHEGSTVIDISQTLFELFACDKCAILEDQDNPEYKYPSISGVRRHESFRRCGGEGTKAFCRPYQVCDSCYRPWFSKRAWQGHCARGCGGRPASRPRAPSSQGSVSSDEVTISAKGASGAQSQPSGNHSTYSPMFDRNNVTEMPYYATGRPVRKAGLKSHERTSSIASLLDPIPRSLPSTSKSVLQKRLSSDRFAETPKRQKLDPKIEDESDFEALTRLKGRGKSANQELAIRSLSVFIQSEKTDESSPSSKRTYGEDGTEIDRPIVKRKRTWETELDQHDDAHLVTQIQKKGCQRYSPAIPWQCVACRRRQYGDACRFTGIREFTLRGDVIVDRRFVSNTSKTLLDLPREWNIIPSSAQITAIKRAVANTLRDPLRHELAHLEQSGMIRRPLEVEVRATCDTCMTSIFSGSWMCSCCGREICGDCYASLAAYDYLEPKVGRVVLKRFGSKSLASKEEITRNRHLYCEFNYAHFRSGFIPVSRFDPPLLKNIIAAMDVLLETGSGSQDHEAPRADVASNHSFATLDYLPTSPTHSESRTPAFVPVFNNFIKAKNLPSSGSTGPPEGFDPHISLYPGGSTIVTDDPSGILSLPLLVFPHEALTEDMFRTVWASGEPLVVTGLLPRFTITWNPDYFIKTYGNQDCSIVECQSEVETESTVKTFFKQFGKYDARDGRLKLKDWPPTEDFKASFPELFADFSQAVPIPNYTRRDGALNIASHFPGNAVAPDLGPKMYNAFESYEGAGGKGSTRLHMDMADAVNVMNYAAPRKDGSPGYAAWNIFRASDARLVRDFLKEHFPDASEGLDPIHSQVHFLDTALRARLYAEKGVRSWRIEQKPGEAVFIPAGCAHQVCNMADCIKVAVDFVSPENVRRCEILTREFREQNQTQAWKEDVLQLRTMMWYAWLSCERLEQLRAGKAKEPSTCSNPLEQRV